MHTKLNAADAYRLCKQSANVSEACFAAGHLDFVGDTHIIQWGPDKKTRKEIPAVYTTNGTHPANSMWARGPIPTCAHANGGYVWRGGSAIDCEPRHKPRRPLSQRGMRTLLPRGSASGARHHKMLGCVSLRQGAI